MKKPKNQGVLICGLTLVITLLTGSSAALNEKTSANPILIPQIGHSDFVKSVAFSRDGRFIVSGSEDHSVKLWKTDGTLIRTLSGHSNWVEAVAISPDGRFIASGSQDNTMKLWSMEGSLVLTIEEKGVIRSLAFSPDSRTIVSADGSAKTLTLWGIDGTRIRTFSDGDWVWSVAFSPDGRTFVSGSGDHTVKLWGIDGSLIRTFSGHSLMVNTVAFSPDGQYIVSGSDDKTIKLWKTDGTPVWTISGQESVASVVFSPDGRQILSGDYNSCKLWNTDGTLVRTFTGLGTNSKHCAAFSPDGRFFVSGCARTKTDIINGAYYFIGTGDITLWKLDGTFSLPFNVHTGGITSISVSPDGKYAISGSIDGSLKIWQTDGTFVRAWKAHDKQIGLVSFSPDGRFILSGSRDLTLKLWKIDGTFVRTFDGFVDVPTRASFSPDGQFIAAGTSSCTLWLKKIDGSTVWSFAAYRNNYAGLPLAFSPDGRIIATGTWNIRLWNIDKTPLRSFGEEESVSSLAFSPDGKFLLAASGYTAKLWTVDGKLISTFTGHTSLVNDAAFDVKSGLIVTASSDNTVRLWKTDGSLVRILGSHDDAVTSIATSPEGGKIVSGSSDATMRVWDMTTGRWTALFADFSGSRWLDYTDDGYWDGSPNCGELVSMVRGTEVWRIDQFAARNNRPDIILKRLGCTDADRIDLFVRLCAKRLKKLGLIEAQLASDFHVPTATITKAEQNGKNLSLSFTLADSELALRRYNVWANDVPLFGAYGKELSGNSATLAEQVELTAGQNKIEVSCMNAKGAESYRAVTYCSWNGSAQGSLYFLGFGVSSYRDKAIDLHYAAKDVQDLAALFARLSGGFKAVRIKTCIDEDVTVENVKKAKAFFSDAGVDDTVVLFISGHGIHDRDEAATYYYITHETDIKNLAGTAANFDLVEELLQGIAPRHKLFLMDTCDSGEMDDDAQATAAGSLQVKGLAPRAIMAGKGLAVKGTRLRPDLNRKDRYIFNDLTRRSGAIVLSSCRGGEYSYESESWQNGLFTFVLKKGFSSEADTDKNGVITTDELRAYVMTLVPQLGSDRQHPTVDRDNLYQKFEFPIARSQ